METELESKQNTPFSSQCHSIGTPQFVNYNGYLALLISTYDFLVKRKFASLESDTGSGTVCN